MARKWASTHSGPWIRGPRRASVGSVPVLCSDGELVVLCCFFCCCLFAVVYSGSTWLLEALAILQRGRSCCSGCYWSLLRVSCSLDCASLLDNWHKNHPGVKRVLIPNLPESNINNPVWCNGKHRRLSHGSSGFDSPCRNFPFVFFFF